LVMQCTRGARARRRARISAVMCGSLARISTPSAGMTRIRFIGSFASGKPLSPRGLPVVTQS
jgi:hypothetical protein